ncbi:hypothetical protein QC999_gp19 [Microbacterium phage Cressida]|uniref:Uncharacterized protein n=2 Tax=Mementomorivirus TaxID=2733194 RepID=A0A514DI89_9CAUD|nr:hypothetical protein HOT41_gp19 [Microbacterium phage MementoMori]YP_010750904.1 hypothetical protein QC999_gp19 [Microbacterium phage Cressida]AWY05344.1 hypothetical protein SEA_MEMENTOMORI_90 [Microbacterium phage MementoMori]QDH93331.1 hypothetical protein PBI_CRESSIDA_89 [Microbacterium phage Cressida]
MTEPAPVVVLEPGKAPRKRGRRADPMHTPTPNSGSGTQTQARQCTAKTRQGGRCRNAPIEGGTVCRMHGGSAPQVKRRAALRLLELVDPAVATLAREMATATKSADRQRAANSILDRAGVVRRDSPAKEDVYDLVAERLRALREQGS